MTDYQNSEEILGSLLEEVSLKYGISPSLLAQLIEFEETKVHLERRRGAKDNIRKMIEDWLEQSS